MKTIDVIAGLIRFPFEKYLIGQRPPGKKFGRLWEFPGGQLEDGETHEECLYREIEREEFPGMRIKVGPQFEESSYEDEELKIRLFGYRVEYISGIFQVKAHTRLAFPFPGEMKNYDFVDADKVFVRKLQGL